jgi:hypothetical protein
MDRKAGIDISLQQPQLGNRVHGWLRIGRDTKKTTIQMVNMGGFRVTLCIIWDLTTISTKAAIPWNPLHRVTCFRLLISLYRRPRRFLSGKTLATPGFRAEINIDIHLLVIVVH